MICPTRRFKAAGSRNNFWNTRPAANITNTGVLKIRDAKEHRLEIPGSFPNNCGADGTNWEAVL